jgi:uncharacterized repeat protein (TIGR01451 family)
MSKLRSSHRGRGRKYWVAAAILVAAAAFAVVFAASSGAVIPPSTFEGNDGNMTVEQVTPCAPNCTDWASLAPKPGLQTLIDLPSGSNDNSFGQGTKENDTNVTVVSGTIPPNKNDLTRSYIYNDQFNGNSFLYLAWERAANSGDAHIDFELNQNPTPGFNASTLGAVTLNRTLGDLLLSYDFGGSGTPVITQFTWNGSAWADQQNLTQQGFAEAAVNTSVIPDVLNNNANVGIGDFGEASINLTDAFLAAGFNPNTCQAFGSITVKARSSGASTSAELKDFIAPKPAHISNCPTPTIATQTSVTTPMNVGQTETVGDTATLTGGNNPTGNVSFQLYSDATCQTAVAGVSGTATPNGSGVAAFLPGKSFTPTQAGTYYWGVSFAGDNQNNAVPLTCGGANETIVVNAANVSITKTPDHTAPVSAGAQIGFTVEVKNTGLGDATGVTLNDPLPAGSGTGVTWSIDSTTGTPAQFVLGGSAGSQTLGLASSTLPANADYTVHIVASTSATECGVYDNTATLTTGNANNPNPANAEEDCLKPGLSVFKTADNQLVDAGDPIGFKITVGNGNGGTATNVTLSDPLPQGTGEIVWAIDSQPAGNPCSLDSQTNPQTLSCSFGDLAANTSMSVHVTATTSFTECTTYDNTATASADNADSVPASASIECRKPALSVTKTADQGTVTAGDPIGFSVTVANSNAAGTGTAKNVTLDDPLPAGTGTGVTWSLDSGPTGTVTPTCAVSNTSPQHLTCSAVDLAPGDSYTVHVTATTSFDECTAYDNTATASADNSPDAMGSASITCQTPNLSVTKTADVPSVNAGDPIGFTINVSNSAAEGTGTAKNVTLSDPLPAGTASDWVISPAYSGPGSCSITGPSGSQLLSCSFGDLAADNSVSVHVSSSTSFAACSTYDNTATASAGNEPDLQASASIACTSPQVVITKTADHSAPVNAGSQIGFTVEIKNTGAGDATGVTLGDPLPAGSGSGVTWAVDTSAGTPAQFALSGAKGSQVLSLGSSTLPAGADYKAHIVASTSQTECGTYNNTATLTTGNANNPNPASASESCGFHVDLSVSKAGSPATQTLGDGNITWTIVVTNHGPDTDTGVTIADPMPAGNTFVSATTTQGTCTGGAILNCTIGTMASGASVTITLVTTPSTVGAQANTVNVAGDRPETNTANNAASATVQTVGVITPPVFCVAVSKVTPEQLFVGRKTGLTIHLTQNKKAVKGVHVLIKGPKLNIRTGASNAKGIVKQTVKMKKAGILIFTPIASKRCNTKRVGVTNVFTPPVTG